jgi:adenine-specific DNA-methyltransferase
MARQKKPDQRAIGQYKHENQQRVNNPPVGLVTPDTDPDGDSKQYACDPHLDPQLLWAGKAEHTSFEVPTVSLRSRRNDSLLIKLQGVPNEKNW